MSSEKRATGAPGRRAEPEPQHDRRRGGEGGDGAEQRHEPGAGPRAGGRGPAGGDGPRGVALERGGELGGAGEAVGGQLGQRGEDRVLDGRRHAPALGREAGGVGGHHLGHDGLRVGPVNGGSPTSIS